MCHRELMTEILIRSNVHKGEHGVESRHRTRAMEDGLAFSRKDDGRQVIKPLIKSVLAQM